MMMQNRRREEHGSSASGELDVFGATSYFAGLPLPPASDDDDCRHRPSSATEPPADRLRLYCFQANDTTTRRMATEGNSFLGPHQQQQLPGGGLRGHAERHATTNKQLQIVAANKRQPQPPSGKMSKLAAHLSFMVSPRASFRKEKPPSTTTRVLLRQAEAASAAAGGERETAANNTYKAADSPSSSSRESSGMLHLRGLFGAHDDDDDDELDLGAATGDRRLQGITVVRGGSGGDEERWVVRCVPGPGGAWDDDEEERRGEKMLDAEAKSLASSEGQNIIKDELVEVEVEQLQADGNIDPAAHSSWDSDSSSDLFDLDLEY